MKTQACAAILLTVSLGACAMTSGAQQDDEAAAHDQRDMEMSYEQMEMNHEPHHALALAYRESLTIFTKALQSQTQRATAVNVEFSRAVVAEMRRSFEQMKQHHQEHMKTMSDGMLAKMGTMIQQMENHQTELSTQLSVLELETQLPGPDLKRVASLTAKVLAQLDAMSKMRKDK